MWTRPGILDLSLAEFIRRGCAFLCFGLVFKTVQLNFALRYTVFEIFDIFIAAKFLSVIKF